MGGGGGGGEPTRQKCFDYHGESRSPALDSQYLYE
jgi:hypothetical protein